MSLQDQRVLVLDAQATGASPAHGHLLELGWAWTTAAGGDVSVNARLIEQPPAAKLPKIITRVTGIDGAALDQARPWDEVWAEFTAACSERAPTRAIVHCARFELSFLQPMARDGVLPFDTLCTLELARRLLPRLPRRGLRALAGYFGLGVEQLRRCDDHVRATAFVWSHLVEHLAQRGIHSWDDAVSFAAEDAPKRTRKEFPLAREKRLALPDNPGVYRMLRGNGDLLYVGKATSLRRRVNSYFQKQSSRDERLLEMLSQVREVEVKTTATPLEAALLETDTIKLLEPPYNLALLGEARTPCFVSRDLLDTGHEASAAFPLGPLPSSWRQRRHAGTVRLLAGERSTDAILEAFGWQPEALPVEVLEEGLALFESRNPHVRRCPRAAGLRRWNTQARKTDEERAADDDSWDPQRVLRNLEDTLVFFALELRRGRWLRRLANAAVSFDDGALRTLVFRGGRVRSRHDGERLIDVRGVEPVFDIATYDRLRVLGTELRRIAADGRPVRVRFCGGRPLDADVVARMLPWV